MRFRRPSMVNSGLPLPLPALPRAPLPVFLQTLALVFALATAGCASTGGGGDRSVETPRRDNGLLNDGYSLLYDAVSGLRWSDELLLVKFESDRFERVVKHVATAAASMRAELERIAEDYPAVRIDRQALPAIELEKRAAVNKDRLLSIAPWVGRSGPAFERTLLLSHSGAVDQMRYLCRVMAASEPDPNLKRFLLTSEQRFAGLYDEVVVLLNQVHFKHDTYRPR